MRGVVRWECWERVQMAVESIHTLYILQLLSNIFVVRESHCDDDLSALALIFVNRSHELE